ncbi:hypothetical protein EV356DRAFT_499287 [Viridothelium virens]|uniref:SAP domain-containing protein n=1 Tax=Viridothelium virens TaxID=1048519 RepID=A0A6A6HCX3_VIRVR|nr:hypothetical protein EV356DRAFT_499287 [Viridothelium virens]
MTDYNKFTVANLKGILKERSIPSTGLTRKQQIIDKLLEHDAQSQSNGQETTNGSRAETKPVDAQSNKENILDDGKTKHLSDQAQQSGEVDTKEKAEPLAATNEGALEDVSAQAVQTHETSSPELVHHETIQPVETESQVSVSQTTPTPAAVAKEEQHPTSIANTTRPSLSDAEAIGDENRKRKRRSLTPAVDPEAVAIKKRKQEQVEGAVHLKEDEGTDVAMRDEEDVAMVEADKGSEETILPTTTTEAPADAAKTTSEDQANEEIGRHEEQRAIESPKREQGEVAPHSVADEAPKAEQESTPNDRTEERRSSVGKEASQPRPSSDLPRKPDIIGKDHRYKELFGSDSARARLEDEDKSRDQDETPDTTPAVHPATPALYIRELKRPLKPEDLRAHLISLSTPPNSDSQNDDSVLQQFYLDSIRSHCFVQFPGVSEASRVRSALHNRTWPAGRDRNPLWVDFVPEENLEDWIRMEEDAAAETGRFGGKRWEVFYRDGADGSIQAIFQEVGPGGSAVPRNAPAGPRGGIAEVRRPSAPVTEASAPVEKQSKAFQSLDELFQSTTAKPKLYYQPVSRDLADKRLDELDRLTDRDALRHGDRFDEYRRYTFEDEDLLVDAGPDYGSRRGGSARGRGSGYRGGYRGGPRYDDGGYRGDRYRSDEPTRGGYGYDRRGYRPHY